MPATANNWRFPSFLIVVALIIGALMLCNLTYTERYIDLNSGRMRTVIQIFDCTTREDISEPPFARIWMEEHGAYNPPQWEQESKVGFISRRSPHFGFHGAFAWENAIVVAFKVSEFTPDMRSVVTSNFLK